MTLSPIALWPGPKSQATNGCDQSSVAGAAYGAGSPAVGFKLKLVATNFGAVTSYSAVTSRGFWPGGLVSIQTAAALPLGSTATSVALPPCPDGESVWV